MAGIRDQQPSPVVEPLPVVGVSPELGEERISGAVRGVPRTRVDVVHDVGYRLGDCRLSHRRSSGGGVRSAIRRGLPPSNAAAWWASSAAAWS